MSPRDLDHSGRLTRFSLDRRITVFVLFISTLVVGAVAAVGIPLELIPRGFEAPFLGVWVPWRDAPAPETEEKIAIPLEEELSTIKGIEGINSFSYTGGARVWLRFKQGTDMDIAYREVRDRVERARARFPADVERVYYRKHDETGIPVAVFGLAMDPNITDPYNLIQKEVILPIQRVDGVASVDAQGLEEKEILIQLDRGKVESAGLNIYNMAQELSGDNFTLASGTVRYGVRKLLLRSVARYESIEEIQDLKIGPDIRLKDIATVTYDEPEKKYRVRVNSRPAFAIVILKEGQANTMEVSRRVSRVLEKIQNNPRLQSTLVISLFNQGEVIDESLSTLLNSGRIGGVLAIGVLFVFLRRFRMTAIITLSIPLSIVIGLTVMYFAGESLNILTLLGLMISVGLLVDNSVVVAENIYRLHREGVERREACIRGAGEIALAIVMATLTTIVVFLPMALVEGQGQFFMLRLAIPVTVSLTASLFVALVFIPLAVYLTLPRAGGARREAGLVRRVHDRANHVLRVAYDATLLRVNHGYTRLLGFFLQRRLDLAIGLAVVFGLTQLIAFQEVSMTEVQENEQGGFEIDVEFPRDTTLQETEAWFLEAEKILEAKKEELGLEGYFVFHRVAWGEMEGWFNNPRTTDLTAREATKILQEALPVKPGMQLYTGEESEIEQERNKSVHVITLQGDQHETLEETAKQLEKLLVGLDGVLGVKRSADREPQELALVLDRERAQRQGVNPAVVAGVVGYALRGTTLPRYRKDGKDIPVRVQFKKEDRKDMEELASFSIPTRDGQFLPLSSVADSRVMPTYRGIFRQNKRVTRNITLELEQGKEEDTRKVLGAVMAQIDLPEGVTLGASQQMRSQQEDVRAIRFAILFSIVLIYLLMGYLFESFILPLSIILTIPLAVLGIGWSHFITGYDIDFLGLVGIVLLIGVVVNNGIVLIDYVNRLRDQGHSRREAVLLAADRRFRPIMMTALTTIFGMVPLLLGGQNSIGLSYTSFGLTLIGGMTTATLLTLLVVPVFYTLFDDLREIFGVALRRTMGFGRRKAVTVAGDPRTTLT